MSKSPLFSHKPYNQQNIKGELSFDSQTTPSTQKTQCEVTIPPRYIVPIIFIPGIMGSNLKNENKEQVWHPDFGKVFSYSSRDAAERQLA